VHAGIDDIRSGYDGRPVEAYFAAIGHDRLNARVGDGESLSDHKGRVLGFLRWLEQQPYACVLVIAHEETLRVMAADSWRLSDEAMIELTFRNCEVLSL
jgi:probable phosphoglycerate mutase